MGEGGWGVSARVRERALRGAGEARFLSPACSHRFRCRPTRTGRRGSKGSTILGSRPPLPAHWSAQGTPLPAPSPARIGTCAPSLSYHAQARKCPRGCVRAQRTAIDPCLATVRGRRRTARACFWNRAGERRTRTLGTARPFRTPISQAHCSIGPPDPMRVLPTSSRRRCGGRDGGNAMMWRGSCA